SGRNNWELCSCQRDLPRGKPVASASMAYHGASPDCGELKMSIFSAIRVALAALLVNKGRTALTSLGIVIGISAVIAMVSAGGGARYKLDDRLESVGKNLILIKPGSRTQLGIAADSTPLRKEDAAAIRKQVGPLLTGVSESQITQRVVSTR